MDCHTFRRAAIQTLGVEIAHKLERAVGPDPECSDVAGTRERGVEMSIATGQADAVASQLVIAVGAVKGTGQFVRAGIDAGYGFGLRVGGVDAASEPRGAIRMREVPK